MPLQKDVQIVSVDDHVIEHPNVWQDRLANRFKEAGPRNFKDEAGNDVWEFEGRRQYNIGLNALRARSARSSASTRPDTATCSRVLRPWERVKDMDVDGMQAQLCFPSFPGFAGSTFFNANDKELASRLRHGLQRLDDRRVVRCQPGPSDPAVSGPVLGHRGHSRRSREGGGKGAKAITFTEMPHALGLPSFHTTIGIRSSPSARTLACPSACISAREGPRPSRQRPRSPPRSPCSD